MPDKMRQVLLILICLTTVADGVPSINTINQLSAKLMKNYNKNTLPSADFTEKFELDITAYLVALGDIDEVEERLSTVMMFIYGWKDASLQWNSSEHGDITNMTISYTDVWKPILLVFNPHQDATQSHSDRSSATVAYLNDGTGSLLDLATFQSTCNIDTTFFPFDIQTCEIKLYVSENNAFEIRGNARWYGDQNFDKENGAWKLVGRNIDGGERSQFKISFQLERKPLFMLVNILLPIIVLAMLTPMVFLMPKNSGERVGYAITTLLAISVYMTIISEHLPKNSDPMPLVSIMIFIWYIMNSSSVLIVIVNTKINHIKDRRPVPRIFRKFVLLTRKIRHERRLPVNSPIDQYTMRPDDVESTERLEINGMDENLKNGTEEEEDHPYVVTWQELSVAIDKWCFVLSYMVMIIIPVVFLTVVKSNRPVHDI